MRHVPILRPAAIRSSLRAGSIAAAAGATLIALLIPSRSDAQYILYHAVHGNWAVTCAQDPPTGRVGCSLSAPVPSTRGTPPRATIGINENNPEAPSIAFRVFGDINAARSVSIMVDTGAPITADSNRYGEGKLEGAAAQALIEAMRGGRKLSFVWTPQDSQTPRNATFDLGAFDAALQDYRRQRASFTGGSGGAAVR